MFKSGLYSRDIVHWLRSTTVHNFPKTGQGHDAQIYVEKTPYQEIFDGILVGWLVCC